MKTPTLRRLLSRAALVLAMSAAAAAQAATVVELFKNPYCGCCTKWAEHMRAAGFAVKTTEVADVAPVRKQLGIPDKAASCHTSKVGGYVLEGHVPPADVQRLLKEKPKALGLVVPGMPQASPGMDMADGGPYEVLLLKADGTSTVFARHGGKQ
ncbi:DUF411 domain-containing protein [Niveibacterium sp. SC-1]|uniref:DUF411 domain-containing protein n=1 Tax=Niveibacterium sp. SC-1 TaxID=3135646 RepID=UPI0031204F0E